MSLVDNPRISPYLDELLGNDSWRLDHIYFNVLRQAPPGEHRLGGMHGGRSRGGLGTHEYDYRNDAFVNGLSVVAYELNDVNPGDGGFGCCPGETFCLPPRCTAPDRQKLAAAVRKVRINRTSRSRTSGAPPTARGTCRCRRTARARCLPKPAAPSSSYALSAFAHDDDESSLDRGRWCACLNACRRRR